MYINPNRNPNANPNTNPNANPTPWAYTHFRGFQGTKKQWGDYS